MDKLINKLLSAKFLIAIMVSVTLCYLAIAGRVDAKDFVIIAMAIVGAYFGQSIAKKGV